MITYRWISASASVAMFTAVATFSHTLDHHVSDLNTTTELWDSACMTGLDFGRTDHGPEGESSARRTVRGVVQVQTTSS